MANVLIPHHWLLIRLNICLTLMLMRNRTASAWFSFQYPVETETSPTCITMGKCVLMEHIYESENITEHLAISLGVSCSWIRIVCFSKPVNKLCMRFSKLRNLNCIDINGMWLTLIGNEDATRSNKRWFSISINRSDVFNITLYFAKGAIPYPNTSHVNQKTCFANYCCGNGIKRLNVNLVLKWMLSI